MSLPFRVPAGSPSRMDDKERLEAVWVLLHIVDSRVSEVGIVRLVPVQLVGEGVE